MGQDQSQWWPSEALSIHQDTVSPDVSIPRSKRDFLPGMGDCVDLPVIGMGWDKDRARDLRGESQLVVCHELER